MRMNKPWTILAPCAYSNAFSTPAITWSFFFARRSVNNSSDGKWTALACHEPGSLVVQHLEAKDGLVDELLGQGGSVFGDVARSQWGSYSIRRKHLFADILAYATDEQGSKLVLRESGQDKYSRTGYSRTRRAVYVRASYGAPIMRALYSGADPSSSLTAHYYLALYTTIQGRVARCEALLLVDPRSAVSLTTDYIYTLNNGTIRLRTTTL
ncbi:hypothetical protein B0H13DRAFT_2339835 [Mycena leptocephala]|nr:hypothetical protein B0H13DRAFT_2339835 [Mycena leptocephala]